MEVVWRSFATPLPSSWNCIYKFPFIHPEEKSLKCGSTRNACGKNKAEMGMLYGSLHDLSFQNYLRYMLEYSLMRHILGRAILPQNSEFSNSYSIHCCGKLLGRIYWYTNFHTMTSGQKGGKLGQLKNDIRVCKKCKK